MTIAQRNLTDDPNVGTISLKRADNAAAASTSATTAAAPKDAVKAYEKARSEWVENKPDKAQKDLQKAVQIDPQFAEAWYQLGKLQEAQKSPDAGNSFQKAVAADPKFAPPYEHLVQSQAQAEKWQDVLDNTNKELEMNPAGSPRIFYYNAVANMKLNKNDAAEESVKKAIAADPQHTEPNAEQLYAVILANKQDLPGALEHLRTAAKYMPPGPNARSGEKTNRPIRVRHRVSTSIEVARSVASASIRDATEVLRRRLSSVGDQSTLTAGYASTYCSPLQP